MKINIRRLFALFLAAILVYLGVRLIGTALEGEEGRLRKAVYKAKRLAEREDVVGLTSLISADYNDELGNDRRALLLIAKSLFDEYRNILIHIDALEIRLEEKSADLNIKTTVYWQENYSDNISYDTAELEARFKKEERHWRLIELKFLEPEKKRLFHPMIG